MNTTLPAINNIAKINNQHIQVISENGQKLVPIRPICDALGIDFEGQRQRLQRDAILSSVITFMVTTGADGKRYEMTTIPLQYIFGWLFTIQTDRVNEEARPTIVAYQKQCYDVLWKHFSGHADYVEYRQGKIDEQLEIVDDRRKDFNECKKHLAESRNELNRWREFTFEHYKFERNQKVIEFPEPTTV